MAGNKYKIAFSGVFDLANYGDHLFPIVFEAMMKKKGLDFELYLFSPIACKEALNDNGSPVYALSDMEKMHLNLHFDAIIVGGGEIIHFYNATQKLEIGTQKFDNYPILQTWGIPSLLAYKYNVRLIWNVPGVLLKFSEKYRHLAKALCGSVDYLSVRNRFSKEALLECGIPSEKIHVYPDSVLQISQIVDSAFLDKVREKLFDFRNKYVVFHTNRFIKDEEIPIVIGSLNRLIEQGYKIVLLPLAYTHGDDVILRTINQQAANQYIEFDKTLSDYEMMSVLSGCTLYIGVSFHGAVTALAYGKKAIAYDFMHYKKTEDLYHSLNIEQYYINEAKDLQPSIDEILIDDSKVNMEETNTNLETHFDNIYHLLCKNDANSKALNIFIDEFIKGVICFKSGEELEKSLQWHINKVQELNNVLESYQKSDAEKTKLAEEKNIYIDELEESVHWHVDKVQELNNVLEGYIKSDAEKAKQIQERDSLVFEQQKKLQELEIYYVKAKNLEQKVSELQRTILNMENSLSWKITKFLRKNQ